MVSALFSLIVVGATIKSWLADSLEKLPDDAMVRVVIHPAAVLPYEELVGASRSEKINYMRDFAYRTQAPIIQDIETKYGAKVLQQFWAGNCFVVELPKWAILELAKDNRIKSISGDFRRIAVLHDYYYTGEDEYEWQIWEVEAPVVWERLGYKGQGVVIGIMDSGADVEHPVLREKYRGVKAWKSFLPNPYSSPCDNEGHGTGVASCAVGDFNLGIAPAAKFIVAQIFDTGNNSATTAGIHNAFQWFADLDSLAPDVVNGSWGMQDPLTGEPKSDDEYFNDCLTLRNMGIMVTFSSGNDGPGKIGSPGDYPVVLSVGAMDYGDTIADFSSGGTAPDQNPWNNTSYWFRPDWNRRIPAVTAPGVNYPMAYPGNEYWRADGTSFSSPAVAGIVALIMSKVGTKEGWADDVGMLKKIYKWLTDYAHKPHGAFTLPNTIYGWGEAMAFKAIMHADEPTVPHIYIKRVEVVSENDNDGLIDPGENVTLKIVLCNLGADASNVKGKLVYCTDANVTLSSPGPYSFGNIAKGDSASVSSFKINVGSSVEEDHNIYLTLKINATGYTEWQCFKLHVAYQEQPPKIDTLSDCDDPPGYEDTENPADDVWYGKWLYAPGACSVLSVLYYSYEGGGTVTSIFVRKHNSDYYAPGDVIDEETVSVNVPAKSWEKIDFSTPCYLSKSEAPCAIWVGVRIQNANTSPPDNVPPYPDEGSKSTNTPDDPSSWDNYDYYGHFTIRAIVWMDSVNQPIILPVDNGLYWLCDWEEGNQDGWIDPSEKAKLYVAVKNIGVPSTDVTARLLYGDALTQNRINITDNQGSFGFVPHDDEGAKGLEDPFEIEFIYDEDSLNGWNPVFKLAWEAEYKGKTYADTFQFSIDGPWIWQPEDTAWWPVGYGGIYILECDARPSASYSWLINAYHASRVDIGIREWDSVYIESLSVACYTCYYLASAGYSGCNGGLVTPQFTIYTWEVGPNGLPGNVIDSWTIPISASEHEWKTVYVGKKYPGIFYVGYHNPRKRSGLRYNAVACLAWGSQFLNTTGTYVDGDNNWSSGYDRGWYYYPVPAIIYAWHDHPTITYYRPSGWDKAIVPSNTQGGQSSLPSLLFASDSTWIKDFSTINRSNIDVTKTFYTGLFVDGSGVVGSINGLSGWSYATGVWGTKIPGGRHTLIEITDYGDTLRNDNIFNYAYNFFGYSFSWIPELLPDSLTAKFVPPSPYSWFSGSYYNVTAYAIKPNSGSRWAVVGVRHVNASNDSTDADLILYSNSYSGPLTGFENDDILAISNEPANMVDFIVIYHKAGTEMWAGVHEFEFGDTVYLDWDDDSDIEPFALASGQRSDTLSFNSDEVVKIWSLPLNAGDVVNCTTIVLSGNLDLGIAICEPGTDYLPRWAISVKSDQQGPGGQEIISFTAPATDTYAVVIWNNTNAAKATSGTFQIGGLSGGGTPVGITERITWKKFDLLVRPNPAKEKLVLRFNLPRAGKIGIKLYDVAGRVVKEIEEKEYKAGEHRLNLNVRSLPAGVYFVRLKAENGRALTRKVVIMK